MNKFLSYIGIFLILSNLFNFNTYASGQINNELFQIKVNDGNNYSSDIEVEPGTKLSILVSGYNAGDPISNPYFEFDFSSTNFTYDSSRLKTYLDGQVTNSSISLGIFEPGVNNQLPLTSTAATDSFMDAFYIDLYINKDSSDEVLTISSTLGSDNGSSSQLTRNVFINSKPHIIDYYFENSGEITTQLKRGGGESVDFFVKVKDYNGCDNIDQATVTADLSLLGLDSSESLVFDSCDSNEALFKKAGITTLVLPDTLSFSYDNFSVTDETGNTNNPDDSQTSFDDEDKKDSINLEVVSAGTPEVTLNINDDYIGGEANNTTDIIFSGNQNGEYKLVIGDDGTCTNGTTLIDWTTGYNALTDIEYQINSSDLEDGSNSLFACFKNDEDKIGSFNFKITKDTLVPSIFAVSATPGNIVLENSDLNFTCSENGEFRVIKGGSGSLDTGDLIGTGSVDFDNPNTFTLENSALDLDDNDIYIFCLDEAQNYSSEKVVINKTTPPPSFEGSVTNFIDNDIDYDGLDGRDILVEWDNTIGTDYRYFESYRIYVLPSNIDLDLENHTYIELNSDKNASLFLGDKKILKDSLGNDFVSGSEYKACISIMGSNGILSTPGCSSFATLNSDTVTHPVIESAKFTNDTTLELTMNAKLDSDVQNHSGSLVSYKFNGSSFNGKSILSVDGQKINIEIDSLGDISATGNEIMVTNGAIRADGGGFNENISFATITDGQTPTITSLTNNTSSSFNNYFTGSINLSYDFGEEMNLGDTKFEIIRVGGNLDSKTYSVDITGKALLKGTNSIDVDLDSLNLVSGTNYQFKIVGKDLAGNFVGSDPISDIKYDNVGPDIVKQDVVSLYSTLTPELTWKKPLDNLGNGSGIKEYKLEVFDSLSCSGSINQTHIVNTNAKTLDTLGDIADYSWKVVGIDNMGNIGEVSICSNFRVDTSVPAYSNFQITDKTDSSTLYIKQTNNVEITSKITDTDIDHIWLDLSQLSGNSGHDNVLCSSPLEGITCIYENNIVKYSFVAGDSITDGVKQVQFNAQNTSGGNDTQQIISITADSTNPVIEDGALLTPNSMIGGLTTKITTDTKKIYDGIGLDYLKYEYSTGAGLWNLVGTGANNGTVDWDLTNIKSGNDYKIQITAYDLAGNNFSKEFSSFEIDRTVPVVPENTINYPNWGEIFGGNGTETIKWNFGDITDTNLAPNPIKLSYSTDNGNNWVLIAENLPNNGSYDWVHNDINFESVLIKLEALDSVGNIGSDVSDNSFIIDTTAPNLGFDFSSTPVHGSFINNSSFDILGNTSDLHFDKSYYIFQNITTGEYYNGNSFTGTTETLNEICSDSTTNGTNGSCDLISKNLDIPIIDGNKYRLNLVSIDEAGNKTVSIPVDYTGDDVNPVISISTLTDTYFKDSIEITGTSSDLGSGISSVKVQIKKGDKYWDGDKFVDNIQTLNTATSDDFANWTYNFAFTGEDDTFEITAIAYDKSYKVNNTSSTSINVIKDSVVPEIIGGKALFTSPLNGDIYIGGNKINILWNSLNITDSDSGLGETPIKLEYFDGSIWNTISENEENDGEFVWDSAYIDSSNVIIRLTVSDKVGNINNQNSETFVIDSTPPNIERIETMDLDANGQIDALNVIMSENIQDSSIILSDFNISDSIGEPTGFETGNKADDSEFVLKFDNIGNSSLTPKLTYTKGSLVDIAGKNLENVVNYLSEDKVSPRLLKSEIYDTDNNGKFDKIISTFSEKLASTSDISPFDINNLLDGISISSVSIIGEEAHIILSEGISFDTDVGNMLLSFNSNSSWTDLENNKAGSITDGIILDKAKPVAYLAEYFDEDGNSKVDNVIINFSEKLEGFQNEDFNVSGLIKNNSSVLNNVVTIDITETSEDNDTGVMANFSFVSGNLKDSYDNLVENISNYKIEDRVIPKLLSIETGDNNGNGKIDNVVLIYSEDLNDDFSNFVGEVDSYNVSSYGKNSLKEVVINVDEKSVSDSDGTPLTKINSNSSLVDSSGNIVKTFKFQSSIDKVGPVIIGARYEESSHKVFMQYSENIDDLDFTKDNFILTNAGYYTITEVNFAEKSITLSGENISYGLTGISFKPDSVGDILGNKQTKVSYAKLSPPIIINEIMVSDNESNNYIELRNLSDGVVDISNFKIAGITIPEGTNIGANGYYLISKSEINNSILNVNPDLVDFNLNISGSSLKLNNSIMDIDFANLNTGFADTKTPKSIERKDNSGDGMLVSSWYTSQKSDGFDNEIPYGTPGKQNIYDATAPIIGEYSPTDNNLFANGNFKIEIKYSDNDGGLGIDTLSDTLKITKWNGTNWGENIADSSVDFAGKVITSSDVSYMVNGLEYGKYKADFSISDKAGNSVNKTIIFYVDEISFSLSTNSSSLGDLMPGINNFSENEIIITIKTLGAGFTIDMLKDGNFTNNGVDIIDWDGITGFGIDQYNAGYSGNIKSMGLNYEIANIPKNINTNGEKNTFVYKLKFGAKIKVTQGAGYYEIKPRFDLKPNY